MHLFFQSMNAEKTEDSCKDFLHILKVNSWIQWRQQETFQSEVRLYFFAMTGFITCIAKGTRRRLTIPNRQLLSMHTPAAAHSALFKSRVMSVPFPTDLRAVITTHFCYQPTSKFHRGRAVDSSLTCDLSITTRHMTHNAVRVRMGSAGEHGLTCIHFYTTSGVKLGDFGLSLAGCSPTKPYPAAACGWIVAVCCFGLITEGLLYCGILISLHPSLSSVCCLPAWRWESLWVLFSSGMKEGWRCRSGTPDTWSHLWRPLSDSDACSSSITVVMATLRGREGGRKLYACTLFIALCLSHSVV